MNVKSRDCSPSPLIGTTRPARIAAMNLGTTAAYWEFGSWREPNTLK
jgi:hypothetical protein